MCVCVLSVHPFRRDCFENVYGFFANESILKERVSGCCV